MSGSKCKSSGDVGGTAKKRQSITMETEGKIIERVEQVENMVDVTCSYNMNCPTISTILKNKDKIMEHVKSAVPMMLTIISKKHGSDGGDGEASQCVDAGSASASSPAQLNADSRES